MSDHHVSVAEAFALTDWEASPLGPPSAWPPDLTILWRALQPASAQVVLFWGADFVTLYNDAFAPTIGDSHPNALGRPASEWSALWEDLRGLLGGVFETGETFTAQDYPFQIEREGSSEAVYFDISYSAVRDGAGAILGVLCIVSETTERVLTERRLREREAELEASEILARAQADQIAAIYRASPVGLAFLDTDLRYVRVNDRLAEWNGFPAEEHIGRTIDEIVPGISEQARGVFNRVLAGEPLWAQEVTGETAARPDGASVWRENWVPLRDQSGAITGIAVSCEDVTEERIAQRALETLNRVGSALVQEHNLDRLVQRVTDAGVELSGGEFGAFFYNVSNAAGESYMLYALSGAARETFSGFPMPRNTPVFAPTFEGTGIVRSDDITQDARYGKNPPRGGMPEGHLPVRSYLAIPVMARDGAVLGGLFFGHSEPGRFTGRHEELLAGLAAQAGIAIENARLIQQVREANETLENRVLERTTALIEAHEALRQSQKMEAMGQLTGGVAHDFNNLLTPIVGSLDLLRTRYVVEPRAQRLVEGALQSAEKAGALVQRLLAFARRQPLQARAVDMIELIEGMEGLISSTIGPQIDLIVDRPETLPPALADLNQVEMALLNLSVNARDAMPDGGILRIGLALKSIDQAGELEPGDYIELSVADSGTGMDPETLTRAIEPFFSTKGVGQGTGLGLSMVHGLARQLGGALRLESVPGKGTNVYLWLPVAPDEAEVSRPESDAHVDPGDGLVLLVDDEAAVRVTTAEMLQSLGYEVVEADSAMAALALFEKGLRPDIVLTDHLMPGMTGTQLCQTVRTLVPDIPTLLMSGYADLDSLSSEFPHLRKPFLAAELATALKAATLVSPA